MNEKNYHTSKWALYIMSGSIIAIGAIVCTYVFAILFTRTHPSPFTQTCVIILLASLAVVFILSLIYVLLESGEFVTLWLKRFSRGNGNESSEPEQEENAKSIKEDEIGINLGSEEKKRLFTKRFVRAEYLGKPVFETIDSVSEESKGGYNFILIAYVSKEIGMINSIPKYKEALSFFGEKIGGRSNYNHQSNNIDTLQEEDCHNMKHRLRDRLKELETPSPTES